MQKVTVNKICLLLFCLFFFTYFQCKPTIKEVEDTKEEKKIFTVNFNLYSDQQLQQKVIEGITILPPQVPLRNGYLFLSWYQDKDLTTLFDFNKPIESDKDLYAKWIETKQGSLKNVKFDFEYEENTADRICYPYITFDDPEKSGNDVYELYYSYERGIEVQPDTTLEGFDKYVITNTNYFRLTRLYDIINGGNEAISVDNSQEEIFFRVIKKKSENVIAASEEGSVYLKTGNATTASTQTLIFPRLDRAIDKPTFIIAYIASKLKITFPNIAIVKSDREISKAELYYNAAFAWNPKVFDTFDLDNNVDKNGNLYTNDFRQTSQVSDQHKIATTLFSPIHLNPSASVTTDTFDPTQLKFHSITFQRFRTQPDEPAFPVDTSYVFIALGSGGKLSHNFKLNDKGENIFAKIPSLDNLGNEQYDANGFLIRTNAVELYEPATKFDYEIKNNDGTFSTKGVYDIESFRFKVLVKAGLKKSRDSK